MFEFFKRLFEKEPISDKTLQHSSLGEYTKNTSPPRLKSGGHGQEALDFMDKHKIEYHITKKYRNGVRVGYVPNHKNKTKQSGLTQSWFPQNWNRTTIKKAGQSVARGKKYDDGKTKSAKTRGVYVGVKRTDGKISTIFPMSNQNPNKPKKRR